MSVTRRGLRNAPQYGSLAVKAGILAGATYPARELTDAATGEKYQDARAGMAVATIAAVHEYGGGKVPPRPFMQTTVAREKANWIDAVVKMFKSGMGEREVLDTIGQVMKEDIQTTINDWPADVSDAWAAKKGSRKGLIFTSEMLNSVSHAVVEEGK